MPGYWRDETSGLLAPAIWRFLRQDPLGSDDLRLLRSYLRQWLAAPYRGDGINALRRQIEVIHTRGDLEHWVAWALDQGIDPF